MLDIQAIWTSVKINHIHERALRLVYQDYTSSFDELLKKDGSLTFHHRNIHQVAIEMFKVKHDLCPPFMKELFTYVGNENGTRSGDTFARPNVDSVLNDDSPKYFRGSINTSMEVFLMFL